MLFLFMFSIHAQTDLKNRKNRNSFKGLVKSYYIIKNKILINY